MLVYNGLSESGSWVKVMVTTFAVSGAVVGAAVGSGAEVGAADVGPDAWVGWGGAVVAEGAHAANTILATTANWANDNRRLRSIGVSSKNCGYGLQTLHEDVAGGSPAFLCDLDNCRGLVEILASRTQLVKRWRFNSVRGL
jgi:hypothetical protein